jgi:hypothetical protein
MVLLLAFAAGAILGAMAVYQGRYSDDKKGTADNSGTADRDGKSDWRRR